MVPVLDLRAGLPHGHMLCASTSSTVTPGTLAPTCSFHNLETRSGSRPAALPRHLAPLGKVSDGCPESSNACLRHERASVSRAFDHEAKPRIVAPAPGTIVNTTAGGASATPLLRTAGPSCRRLAGRETSRRRRSPAAGRPRAVPAGAARARGPRGLATSSLIRFSDEAAPSDDEARFFIVL